jgi:PAS domain S-box-containing protein
MGEFLNKKDPTDPDTRFQIGVSIDDSSFRGFIENLPVMFYAVEPAPPYKPVYISPMVEKFGYPLESWMSDPDLRINVIHEQDRRRFVDGTSQAMAAGEGIDFEYRIVGKDGSIFWVRDRSCFIQDEAGKPLCWQGVILDITERKLAVLETQKRDKLYRTLASHIPKAGVLLFDQNLRYTLADGEQLELNDFTREMYEGKSLSDICPPEMVGEWSEYYHRALAGEKITFEVVNERGCFQMHFVPVKDEHDEIFAGMVMWQDITERRRSDDALKESEARYRQLFENANDIIYVHDLNGKYLSINEAGARVFGYTVDEALALNMAKVIVPEHLDLVRGKLTTKVEGSTPQTIYEVDCIKKDGTRITLEVNSSLITRGDQTKTSRRIEPTK